MFRARFQNRQFPDGVKRPVLHRAPPAFLCRPLFELGRFVHDELPLTRGDLWIARHQISPGNLQIDGWLPAGLVLGVNEPLRVLAIPRCEAGLFVLLSVEGIKKRHSRA
jgi:hypothetical protein